MTLVSLRRAAPLRAALIGLAAAAPLALAPAAGIAQQSQQQQQSAPAEAADFSDSDLRSFALAMLDVRDIVEGVQPKLAEAEGEAAKQELRKSATEDMVSAVQERGLSVETYNAIAETARQDPELAEKITGYAKEESGGE
ncbi:MAG: DUF4168 domain-containing protein [Pseudomonadota bacterium]